MDFIGIKFYQGTSLISWPVFGTEMVFKARETTGAVESMSPWFNETTTTEGGFSAQIRRKRPWQFTFNVQILEPVTLQKLDNIQEAIALSYKAQFRIIGGYLLANASLNSLFDNSASTAIDCTIDVGDGMNIRNIRQAAGHEWKHPVPIIVRERLELVLPNAGDVIVVGSLGGN